MNKLRYGRLDYDPQTDTWEVITQDGSFSIPAGARIGLGQIGGIAVHAVLVRDGCAWTWAVTDIPHQPIDGMQVAYWEKEPTPA